ncbi:hypothetical protein [Pseudarthrobacter sp. PH31-O2]|uniref:hypothetical protein n=1 Tax=Pseudarthrobacter sp. PH31-O2 TaxID=3046206 RepID=UPI0024B98897|nr:hypothetical protein [Pseudarthrobacter sp. PH31-O2]MDJ0354462.1 hypothetical protein [Pseudarthrobacter sp. PH31-O2]
MPDLRLKPVTPGKLNRPAWMRTRTAELGPDVKAGEGPATLTTADVYLDGALIGSVTGAQKPNSTLRAWVPNRLGAGVNQHGDTRFQAIDALVGPAVSGGAFDSDCESHSLAHLLARTDEISATAEALRAWPRNRGG